jgi:FkbM family methyltransferase
VTYFPPLNQNIRGTIRKLVKEAKSEKEVLESIANFCESHPILSGYSYTIGDNSITIHQSGRDIHIPTSIPPVKHVLLAYGYAEWLKRKYTNPGICEVEPGDVVLDCGAYVGGFSMGVAETASKLLSFEPSPVNFACLEKNAAQFTNVIVYPMGLGRKNETRELNLSSSSVEHSFLAPDRGRISGTHSVEVQTIETVVSEAGIETLDFLKIEAEGFEVEVFQGLGQVQPRKIAIDVSPERNGESPKEFFAKELGAKGYDLVLRGNVLFGVRP